MKKLNEIIDCNYNILIKNIKIDSREVEKDDLFVAVKGLNVDHDIYIDEAIKNGAVAVISEKYRDIKTPLIVVEDINKTLVDICQKFYDYNKKMKFIGITGTDGKTTTATIIKKVLNYNVPTAYIGTNGIEMLDKKIITSNTTPTPEKIYMYLNEINKKNITNVVMEVSSEALFHKRVESLRFKYAIYTNITEDHLNIHKTMNNYIESKLKLIDLLDDNGIIIINKDDSNLKKIKFTNKYQIYTYGKNKNSDFMIKNIQMNKNNSMFTIRYKNKEFNIKTQLIGEYNMYNLTASFAVALLEKNNPDNIIDNISKIDNISGRGEKLDYGQKYTIILDYAHTLNGIKNIVETYKKIKQNRLIVITGSAGGREKEKRSKIGKYLLNNTDLTVFTMDDPRYEKVEDIINDMLKDTTNTNYKKIISRKEAIKVTLNNALKDDIILILGKGRDNYMAIDGDKIKYSDYEEINKYFKK